MQVLQKRVKDALEKVQLRVKILIEGASGDARLPHDLGNVGFVKSFMGERRLGAVDQALPSEVTRLDTHLSATSRIPTERLTCTLGSKPLECQDNS